MKRRRDRGSPLIPALAFAFSAGIATGWWLKSGAPLPAVAEAVRSEGVLPEHASDRELELGRAPAVAATTGEPLVGPAPTSAERVVTDLRRRQLRLPIDGADVRALRGGFAQRRDGGSRGHEAVDILAPRNTPVHAVEDGTIAKLFTSKAGGITVYQFDPAGRYCYYYAHLQRYANGLREGQQVSRGDVIGYVGTTGNAPPNTPHLHFAVFELDAHRQWWKGRAIDPYLVFEGHSGS
jgi:murein DD-endopeptidase MepM/ murein hydrolase activator NlpD